MKKIAFTFAIVAAFMSARAQDKTDVLRYSQYTPGGSARAQAIGGATGSIGGDYSSIFSNPSGVGFFKTSEFSFGLNFNQANDKSTYLNTAGSDSKGNLNINSLGLILAGRKKNPHSKWQNVTVGIGYNRLANYNQNSYYRGANNQSSIGSQYVSQLHGVDTAGVYDSQYAFGPLEAVTTGFLVGNFDANGNPLNTWTTISPYDDPAGGGVLQEKSIYTSGRSELYNIAVGGNYDDKFYIGGSVGFPHIQYDRTSVFRETNDQGYQYLGYTMKYYEASDHLSTSGNGIQANIGAIYRPIPALRIGATFMSPQWLWLNDSYYSNYTTADNTGTYTASTIDEFNGSDVQSHYNIRTPWRGVLSGAYVFTPKNNDIRKPSGFLTVDYEYEDYKASSLKYKNGNSDDNQGSMAVQNDIKDSFKAASNVRVGGEIKIDVWAFRAGFAYYGNPYSTGNLDGSRKYYSGGIGYRNRGFYADLTYVYMNRNLQDQPYTVGADQAGVATTPAPAEIKSTTSNVALGIGFKF